MLKIKTISESGSNYFFSQQNFYGFERGVFYNIDTYNFNKYPQCFGGIAISLYNGKKLCFTNKAFYIKE